MIIGDLVKYDNKIGLYIENRNNIEHILLMSDGRYNLNTNQMETCVKVISSVKSS